MTRILAVAEQRDGALRRISEEIVSAAAAIAADLGATVDALVLGPAGISESAAGLGAFGAERVLVAEDDALSTHVPEIAAATVARVVREGGYHTVLFGASATGRDLAPRVAAILDVPLATDATALDVDGGEVVITRPMYGGRAFARVVLEAEPRLVSVRSNVFRPVRQDASGSVEKVAVEKVEPRVRVRETRAVAGDALDVGEAPIVVSGGRGLKGPENWHLLEELCSAIGADAALGASRAVVDAGWRPHAEQVGQTGKTVSPKLYFAVGISGAMQHLAGMRSAGRIVAINKDADAPIFKIADYGVVGDAAEILPKLSAEIRTVRGG
jgi:electron transfer flavoprotein alpha subunit